MKIWHQSAGSQLVEKPTVFRQFTGFMQFLVPQNCIKPQCVGCAGKARLAHEIILITYLTTWNLASTCRIFFVYKRADYFCGYDWHWLGYKV